MTARGIEVLQKVALILAEDTRTSRVLLIILGSKALSGLFINIMNTRFYRVSLTCYRLTRTLR